MMHHLSDCSCDQCLLAKMKAADPLCRKQGWEAWYNRDAPILHLYLRHLCWTMQCPEHANDLLQDTFLIGFRNVSSGLYDEHKAPLCGYLRGVAKNLVRELLRAQQRVPISLDTIELESNEALEIDNQLYLEDVCRQVKEALESLPSRSQYIAMEFYVHGKTANDAAKALGITANNLRVIAYRAVKDIGQYLEHKYHTPLSTNAIRMCLESLQDVVGG